MKLTIDLLELIMFALLGWGGLALLGIYLKATFLQVAVVRQPKKIVSPWFASMAQVAQPNALVRINPWNTALRMPGSSKKRRNG